MRYSTYCYCNLCPLAFSTDMPALLNEAFFIPPDNDKLTSQIQSKRSWHIQTLSRH